MALFLIGAGALVLAWVGVMLFYRQVNKTYKLEDVEDIG